MVARDAWACRPKITGRGDLFPPLEVPFPHITHRPSEIEGPDRAVQRGVQLLVLAVLIHLSMYATGSLLIVIRLLQLVF